jgi:hypothetical protein
MHPGSGGSSFGRGTPVAWRVIDPYPQVGGFALMAAPPTRSTAFRFDRIE